METIGRLETVYQDLRYAVRMLLKGPGFTCVALLSVAIGVGINVTVFSVMNAVLLRPLPYLKSDQLVMVRNRPLKRPQARVGFSLADLLHWRREALPLTQIEVTSWGAEPSALTGAGTPERVGVACATHGLFSCTAIYGSRAFRGGGEIKERSRCCDQL
jgi:putative ABC transport system permease protein